MTRDGLLSCDGGELVDGHIDDFLVLCGITETLVHDDFLKDGHLHGRRVVELLLQGRSDALLVYFL